MSLQKCKLKYCKNKITKTIFVFLISMMLFSCTISFQNISTHGQATDLVDENQDANATVSPDISVPIKPV